MENKEIIQYLEKFLKRVYPNSPDMVALEEAIKIVKKEAEE